MPEARGPKGRQRTSRMEAAPAASARSSCSVVSSIPPGLRSWAAARDGVPSALHMVHRCFARWDTEADEIRESLQSGTRRH